MATGTFHVMYTVDCLLLAQVGLYTHARLLARDELLDHIELLACVCEDLLLVYEDFEHEDLCV